MFHRDDTNPRSYQVRIGTNRRYSYDNNSILLTVDQIIMHPEYDTNILAFDIAILKLKESDRLEYNDHIQPVCLPRGKEEVDTSFLCYTSGWGTVSEYQ